MLNYTIRRLLLAVPTLFFISFVIFMLLAPNAAGADHLRALAQVSRTFRNADLRAALRQASSQEDISAILCPQMIEAGAA